MAQQAANLSSQLTTGKVPIPRFKAGHITDAAYIEMELQLKAALTSQQCGDAWSSIPCVADDTAEDAAANTRNDANKKKIEQCNVAIALLIASFSQNKSLTAVIKRSCTTEWPNGRPWDIFDRLTRRFKRFNKAGRQHRMAQLAAIAMGRNDNPQDMFDEVQDILYLNDTAAPNDPPTSTAKIRDWYEMKLPVEILLLSNKPKVRTNANNSQIMFRSLYQVPIPQIPAQWHPSYTSLCP